MIAFTKAQIEAIMTAQSVTGATVEEYAAQNGFTIVVTPEVKKVTTRAKRPVGKTSVVILHSAETGTALLTTNSGFAGRTAEWILADWVKTVSKSRKSDARFATLVQAEDVQVHIGELQDFLTDDNKANVEKAAGLTVAHFEGAGYEFISKIARGIRTVADANAVVNEEEETAESSEQTVGPEQEAAELQSTATAEEVEEVSTDAAE